MLKKKKYVIDYDPMGVQVLSSYANVGSKISAFFSAVLLVAVIAFTAYGIEEVFGYLLDSRYLLLYSAAFILASLIQDNMKIYLDIQRV